MRRLLFMIVILVNLTACKEVYEAPPQAMLQAAIFNSATNKAMSPLITTQGVGLDSMFYREQVMSNILFPLSAKDTTRYIIWLDSKSDSIIFIHKIILKYASIETGFYYEYKLHSVRFTKNRIDSVKIVDSLVTTKWNENIKLYIHPLSVSGN